MNKNFLYREQMTVSTLPLDRVHMESTAGGGADLVFRYMVLIKGSVPRESRDASSGVAERSFVITDTAILFRNKFTSGEQKGKRRDV